MRKFFYRVEKADTLFSISNQFSISVVRIINLNNLKKEVQEGDLLYLEAQTDCALYHVQPFETSKTVADKFGVSEELLLKKNNVEYFFYGLIVEI